MRGRGLEGLGAGRGSRGGGAPRAGSGVAFLLATAAVAATLVAADEATHRYSPGDPVMVWLSKVGPLHNPQETYPYYSLPFCAPATALEPQERSGFSEWLDGGVWRNSDLSLRFREDVDVTPYCSMDLRARKAGLLEYAVANHYWYQMVLDDLPMYGFVGEMITGEEALQHLQEHGESFESELAAIGGVDGVEAVSFEDAKKLEDHEFVFAHRHFDIGFNDDRIVEVNLTSDQPVHVREGAAFDMTYSVTWHRSQRSFDSRFQRYLDRDFFHHRIRYMALMNSFVLVFIVLIIVGVIFIRTLRQDLARYMTGEDEGPPARRRHGDEEVGSAVTLEGALVDESGWKQVRGDVFRPSPSSETLAALLGSGVQLIFMGIGTVGAAAAFSLYMDQGAVATAMLVLYALTSAVAGVVSGAWYRAQHFPRPAPRWKQVMFLTATLIPILAAAVVLNLNFVAYSAATTNSVPLSTLLTFLVLWGVVNLPLVVAGTLLGRRLVTKRPKGQTINPYPRPIPAHSWMTQPLILALCAGFAPFGAIYMETYFVFAAYWGYKVYFVFELMLLVCAVLVIVVACSAIIATYILLQHEDHRWHWPAFGAGASVGLWVFLYALYYFIFNTGMHGYVQTSFYLGYTSLACICLSVAAGSVSFFASSTFIHYIFASIKGD